MSIVSSGITLNTAYNVTGDLTGNLIFQSNGTTEAVRIDTNQNVGIGTANPGQKLEVNGWVRTGIGASATGGLELPYYSGSASSRTWRLRNDVSAYGDFSIAQATTQGGATYDNKFYIDASGNVGLGTVSPTYKLNVTATNSSGDNGAILVTSPSTDGTQFRLNNTSASGHSYTFYSTGSGNSPGAGALGIYDQTANGYRMIIDASGRITMPAQPAFSVQRTATVSAGNVIAYDTVISNIGSNYSTSTGRFTAPVAGNYLFYCTWTCDRTTTTGDYYCDMRKNGTAFLRIYTNGHSDANAHPTQSGQFVFSMAAGDYVDVYFANGATAIHPNSIHNVFGGHLIG